MKIFVSHRISDFQPSVAANDRLRPSEYQYGFSTVFAQRAAWPSGAGAANPAV
jgi:hypothetical protein